jgi:hypothetical protein
MGLMDIIGGKKVKGVDVAGMNNIINQTSAQKKSLITGVNPKLEPLTDQYKQGATAAFENTDAAREQNNADYLKQFDASGSAYGDKLFAATSARIKQALPQKQADTREIMAATGGLQRGASATALMADARDNTMQVNDAATEIGLSQLKGQQDAITRIHSLDDGYLRDKLGMTRDDLNMILNSGREDIIREFTSLLDEADQTGADRLGAEQLRVGSSQAADIANNQNRMAIINAAIQAGGQVTGMAAAGAMRKPTTGVVATN